MSNLFVASNFSNGIRPPLWTMDTWLWLSNAMLHKAPNAFSCASPLPIPNKRTNESMPPCLEICDRNLPDSANFQITAAALAGAPPMPSVSNVTIGLMPPASTSAFMPWGVVHKDRSAPVAFSCGMGLLVRSIFTNGLMPPASKMLLLFGAFSLAKLCSTPAARPGVSPCPFVRRLTTALMPSASRIAARPCGVCDMFKTADTAFICPSGLSVLSNATNGGIPPAVIIADLNLPPRDMLLSAPAEFTFAKTLPPASNFTRAGIPFAEEIVL
mmetsp:Transcript_4828/g.13477  ORF Transcript_4828/g.13477 Transcript_4828/m.13477 type:complete len:271 (+) Transcript_4828:1726-2538(+)